MPLASTRIVAPRLELEAVLTSVLDPVLLVWIEAPAVVAELLLELLPQALSSAAAARAGMMTFRDLRMFVAPNRWPGLTRPVTAKRRRDRPIPS
jgi:hypothetical protein